MSNRPKATPSHPFGTSTNAGRGTSVETRIARCKRFQLSAYPRCTVNGKHINKQGFPNTMTSKSK